MKKIAVIAGDGIGTEVISEGLRVLDMAARRFDVPLSFDHFDFASCEYFARHGQMMPDDWKTQIGSHDAIYFGAVGWPATVPDHVSLWGSLLKFRREFDQYVNLRPCRLMPGIPSPLANRKPGDIDFYVVRENTEGEYSSVGGRMYEGTPREAVYQQSIFSRHGTDRILKYAFELAQRRPKKHLTSATKSNGIAITMPYWDERVAEMARHYPDIQCDKFHIDIPTGSMWWWLRTCSATSCPTSAPPVPARLRLRLQPISIPKVRIHRCLNPCMAQHLISRARVLQIRSDRSGVAP